MDTQHFYTYQLVGSDMCMTTSTLHGSPAWQSSVLQTLTSCKGPSPEENPEKKNDMEMPRCVILKVDPWASKVFGPVHICIICVFPDCLIRFHVAMAQPLQCSWWLRYNLWIPVAWLTTVQRQLFHFPASHARAFTWAARCPGRGQHEKPWR